MTDPYKPPPEVDGPPRPYRNWFSWRPLVAAFLFVATAIFAIRVGVGPIEIVIVLSVCGILLLPAWRTK